MSLLTKLRIRTSLRTCTSPVPCFGISQSSQLPMNMNRSADIQVTVDNFDQLLHHTGNDWDAVLGTARDVMVSLETTSFFDDPNRREQQIHTVEVLQKLAYHDVDAGGVADLAELCLERWLKLHQVYPDNVAISKGIGQWWLLRAQPCLSRIHAIDGSSSSGEAARGRNGSDPASFRSSMEERQAEMASQTSHGSEEAEQRLHTADYVEARGILLPAVDYLRQAVEQARSQDILSGPLLVTAAEAYMSIGNVSYSRVNEEYFCQAIQYLRTASQIPGFPLPAHLQRYLDDYGRFA